MRESGGRRVPTFRWGARGILGEQLDIASANEVKEWRGQYRETHIARRNGDTTMSYPFGTYAAGVHYGQPVQSEPPQGALVAMPGPLLSDLSFDGSHREQSFELLQNVQDAFSDEAEQIATEYEVAPTAGQPQTAAQPQPSTEAAEDEESDEGPEVVVRHRFGPRTKKRPRRIVVLRDRRRGRPNKRHGSDPPDRAQMAYPGPRVAW